MSYLIKFQFVSIFDIKFLCFILLGYKWYNSSES
jgi:hypothetical protein